MASLTLPPFHVLSDVGETHEPGVVASEWEINGRSLEDATLPGWDYGVDILARRRVRIATATIREQTRLGAGTVLRIVATWSTGAGFECREVGFASEVILDNSDVSVEIEFPIPGASLAVAVVLSTQLVLARRSPRCGAGAAIQPGSLLWQDDSAVTIEGTGPRVPVLVVDLDPKETAWSVSTTHDWLNAHPSVGVLVNVNRERDDIVRALLSEPPGDRDVAIRSALFFDVGRQLVERALSDEDFVDDAGYAPQTCGLALTNRIRALFAGRSLEQVRALRLDDPEEFNRLLQAGHNLFA
jgi:hypothetical protein